MKLRILLTAIVALALSLGASSALAEGGDDQVETEVDKKQLIEEKKKLLEEKKDLVKQKAKAKRKKLRHPRYCRPAVGIKLRGEITELGDKGFAMMVMKANRHGKRFVAGDGEAKVVYLHVSERTKFRRGGEGPIEFGDLAVGDHVKVKSRGCKRVLKDADAEVKLYAAHVKVKGAETDEETKTEEEQKTDGTEKTEVPAEPTDGSTDQAS